MLCPFRAKIGVGMPESQGVALGGYVKAFQALRPVFMYTLHFHNHLE